MKFAFYHSVKNMKRKPLRSALLSALVLLIAFTVFSGAFVIISLQAILMMLLLRDFSSSVMRVCMLLQAKVCLNIQFN